MQRKNSTMLLKYHNDLNQITLKGLNARESNVFFAICAIMKDHGLNELTLSFNDLKRISNITVIDESELISIIKETYHWKGEPPCLNRSSAKTLSEEKAK